ncbi:MAG: tetratricopeptide repeat protein [Candidatus Obscuribacterales bacterium]|nr:tetratricopeptide repeat protein [Candidatus Obscuribacterales bacterium]
MRSLFLVLLLLSLSLPVWAQSGAWVQLYEAAQMDIGMTRWSEAESALKTAMPFAEALGRTDLRYAFTMGSLGRVYVAEDRFAEAEPLLLKAIDLLEKANYKEQEVADYCLSYQDLLIKSGRRDEALQVNEAIKQLVHQKVSLQKGIPDPWQVEYDAGMESYRAHRLSVCEPHLLKALEISKTQVGAADEVRKSTAALFALYRDQHRYQLVDFYFPKLQVLLSQCKGAKSVAVAGLLEEYAGILAQQKRIFESHEMKAKADAIYEEIAAREKSAGISKLALKSDRDNSHFSWNGYDSLSFLRTPATNWNLNLDTGLDGGGIIDAQAEAMRESYLREADIVAQTERNTRALESRQLQLEILHPNYMSRYYRH